MDEIVVRVARTVACLPRLRILSLLARSDKMTPTHVSRDLRIPLDMVCAHLRRLTTAGLIVTRRSGTWCYCAAQSPYAEGALSAKITAWLRSMLGAPKRALKHCGPDRKSRET